MRIFVGVAPEEENDLLVREALAILQLSKRLLKSIKIGSSLREGVLPCKKAIIRDLARAKHREEAQASLDERMNDQLFAEFFPADRGATRNAPAQEQGKKRLSSVAFPEKFVSPIPKKTMVPALASLHQFSRVVRDLKLQ